MIPPAAGCLLFTLKPVIKEKKPQNETFNLKQMFFICSRNCKMWKQCVVFSSCTDQASREKERLEEKQRASRKERAKRSEEWKTR